jgi:hypothetical protein
MIKNNFTTDRSRNHESYKITYSEYELCYTNYDKLKEINFE